jgi:glycosyltransferase involved in cell wall biosynthesis
MSQVPRAVTFFIGARDNYQLPIALCERDLLEAFVTELYWPFEHRGIGPLMKLALPRSWHSRRHRTGLPSVRVRVEPRALSAVAMSTLHPGWSQLRARYRAVGATGRRIASRSGAPVFSYSYYVHEAFREGPERPDRRFIFQLHPHPLSVQRILRREIQRYPWASASLEQELELSPDRTHVSQLCEEPALANGWVCASSFTARTLAEHGVPRSAIHVVPYGVDVAAFPERSRYGSPAGALKILFVGSMVQRKGLCDLLEAMRLVGSRHIHLTIAGRGFIDTRLLKHYSDVTFDVQRSPAAAGLVQLMHRSDLFVLPSVVEGFGHVILEAMCSGLPVLASSHTCAADLIREGVEGWVIPPCSPEAIAYRLAWASEHRTELSEMGGASAVTARTLTWERFRERIRTAYAAMLEATGHCQ